MSRPSTCTPKQFPQLLEQLVDGMNALPEAFESAKAADAQITGNTGLVALPGNAQYQKVQMLLIQLAAADTPTLNAWHKLVAAEVHADHVAQSQAKPTVELLVAERLLVPYHPGVMCMMCYQKPAS